MKLRWRYRLVLAALMASCLVLGACGGQEKEEVAAPAAATASPQATPSAEATLTPEATPTPEPTLTPEPAPQETPTPAATATSSPEIGVESIWDPSENEDRLRGLHECSADSLTECVTTIMQESGASAQAMDFWRLTGWFLGDFQEMGAVDLGTIVNPWRANENVQLAFLNGSPAFVYPEEEGQHIAIERDPNYDALLASFPDLDFWPSGSDFEAVSASDQGGQRFVLQFRLIDGCRACSTGYFARAAFDFAAEGTYLGVDPQPLGVCGGEGPDVTPVGASIPACPLP